MHERAHQKNVRTEESKHSTELKEINEASTLTADHLFEANQNCNKLGDKKREESKVTKALFLCKSRRPDSQPAVPFLCTTVQSPDEADWKRQLRLSSI